MPKPTAMEKPPETFDFFMRGFPLEVTLTIIDRWGELTEPERALLRLVRWDVLTDRRRTLEIVVRWRDQVDRERAKVGLAPLSSGRPDRSLH